MTRAVTLATELGLAKGSAASSDVFCLGLLYLVVDKEKPSGRDCQDHK